MKRFIIISIVLFATMSLSAQSLNFTMDWINNDSNFEVGTTQQITWESVGVENIKLEYATDAGKNWNIIIENYPDSIKSYDWMIPNTPSIYCLVKISSTLDSNVYYIHPATEIVTAEPWKNKYFSIHGKNSWENLQLSFKNNFTGIKFIDSENGFIWGKNVLLHTNDGGLTWEIKSEFVSIDADFISPNRGWILQKNTSDTTNNTKLLLTNDGGVSWSEIYKFYSPDNLAKISFADSSEGVLGYVESLKNRFQTSRIFKTIDSGNSWDLIQYDGIKLLDVGINNGVYWYKDLPGLDVTIDYYPKNIAYSINQGENWSSIPGNPYYDIYAPYEKEVWFANITNSWVIIKYDNTIHKYYYLYTKNSEGFNLQYTSDNRGPENIYFINEKVGWFWGWQGMPLYSSPSPNILFTKQKRLICSTKDGGMTWELQYFEPLADSANIGKMKINSFFSLDGKTAWAVGDSGLILKYEDLGLNNINYKFTFESYSDSIYTLSNGVFLEGENYFIESLNLPEQLEKHEAQINVFEGAKFTVDKDAINEDISLDIRFMGNDTSGILTNPIDNTPLFMFWGIEVTGEQSGVTSFEDFYYLNEGKKARLCIPKTDKLDKLLEELGIDEENLSFAYVKGGEYFDEGLEWEIREGEEGKVDSLCLYLDHFSKIIGGKNLLTSVEIEEENLTTQFSLEQNYPNPFNPVTTINYSIPSNVSTSIRLSVFDVLGREVKTLVNETKSAGRYEVSFDASNITSGIYYYQIKVGSFIETKKMVLMK